MLDPNKPPGTDALPPNSPPPPGPSAGGGDDTKKMLEAKTAEAIDLKTKNDALMTENATLKTKVAELEAAKGKAEANADALAEELVPIRERVLIDLRARSIRAVNATGALADEINKASRAELPAIVVAAHYDAQPQARAVVDSYDAKIKDGAWTNARFDMILEAAVLSTSSRAGNVSDDFRHTLRVPSNNSGTNTSNDKPSGQAELDALQNGGN